MPFAAARREHRETIAAKWIPRSEPDSV